MTRAATRARGGAIALVILGAAAIAAPVRAASSSVKGPGEATKFADEWPLPHRDYGNSRATTDSTITAANVATLDVEWSRKMPGRGLFGNLASTPVIADGVAYVQDLMSNVFALSLDTGKVVWKRTFLKAVIGPNGVGIGYGKAFVYVGRGTVYALDLKTGKTKWKRSINLNPLDGVSIQPTPVAGLVLMSTVPANINEQDFPPGTRGVLEALDQRTGRVVWRFDTVKSKDLWGHPYENAGGGAWYPPAIDLDAGVAYWGIGNPAPWPGNKQHPGGTGRLGDNLYTDSVLAIGLRDGKLRWYQQPNPHDLFDHDLQLTMLMDVDGRRLVIASGKLGTVFAYDAATGDPVWNLPVGEHQNDTLTEINGPTRVAPGPLGGVLTPMAHADNVIYAAVVDNPATYIPDSPNFVSNFAFGDGKGRFVAVDAATGKLLWEHMLPSSPYGGATVVNDLVFTATEKGVVYALDRATGEEIWSYTASGGINGWMAAAGDTILVPVGVSPSPVLLALRIPS